MISSRVIFLKDIIKIQDKSITISKKNNWPLFALGYEIKEFATYPLLHSDARFWYFVDGDGTIVVQGKKIKVGQGTLLGVLPWQYTEITEVNKPLKLYIIVFEMELMDLLLKSYNSVFGENIFLSDHIYKNIFVNLNKDECEIMDKIVRGIENEIGFFTDDGEISDGKSLTNFLLTSYLIEVFTIFIRASEKSEKTHSTGEREMIELFHYIYYHLNDNFTLSDLSKRFFISESSISKYIKDTIGITYSQLTSTMKISKLMYFLTFSNKTLQELAIILGYTDASHLTKFFKSQIGVSIGYYKKQRSITPTSVLNIDLDIVQNIYVYMLKNYSQDLNQNDVAKMFKISPNDLNNVFTFYFGKTFKEYLNYIRIINASEKLLTTDSLISDIAYEVGYNTTKTFDRNFTKIYNMPPSQFKKKVNMQNSTI